ncbi:MAG: GGDEF domain-containing protein [Lachnospiraceae bacterium]|nr:GGDEF domain-containing protein [Lachnospiraceae bacterium]
MNSNRKINTVTAKILTTGLVILLGCLLACGIHLFIVGKICERNAEENLMGHMQVALEVINSDVETQKEVTQACADAITYNKYNRDVVSIMWEYMKEYEGYEFYLATPEGITYYANGVKERDGAYETLSTIHNYEYTNGFICITQEGHNVKGEHISYWVGIQRVELDGYDAPCLLMSRRQNQDIFDDECFTYLSNLGVCSIITKEGMVVTADENYVRELGLSHAYFDELTEYSNGSDHSHNQINKMQISLSTATEGDIEFYSDDGRNVLVAYKEIRGTRDRFLTVMFHEDILYDMVQPVLLRSFILWVIILVIMMLTIGFVWSQARSSQKNVERLAFSDEVTGGRNLNYFRQKAAEIINQNRETPFLIYRFDILNFRYINEAYGHKKADAVLKACVQEFGRIYSRNELCVRINSDHFMALVINDAEHKTKYSAYTKAVGECARLNEVRYPIRLRMGIYQVRKDDYDIDIMIDHANAARKSLTGNEKVLEAVYSEKIVSNMKKVDAIESQMQSAIINDEFKIFLQPKWDIVNDCLVGAEALVRWIKKDGSMVYPSDFIPLFESNGFIEKLDFHMLEMLCKRIHDIETEGIYKIVPISVNQSRILINNPDYIKNVEKVISRYETNVKNLEIEITETVFFDEKSKMIEVVNQLKALGLNLAMDDFGSGYSSLNILRDIPFDILKIDREFVSESVASQSSIIIMQKIIEMAQGLNIKVICEGVETKEQIDTLRELGCTMVQGYYYDKPIPMDDFLEKYCRTDVVCKEEKPEVSEEVVAEGNIETSEEKVSEEKAEEV